MIIDEIEKAEKKSEQIIENANKKASDRIRTAKLKSYNHVINDATEKAKVIVSQEEKKANGEGKSITSSSKKKFSISTSDKNKLVDEIVKEVLKSALSK